MIGGSQHGNLAYVYTPPPPSGIILTGSFAGTAKIVVDTRFAGNTDTTVNWGNGSSQTFAVGSQHYVVSPTMYGTYDVEITGNASLKFGYATNGGYNLIWKNIKRWGTLFTPSNTEKMFQWCEDLQCSATDAAGFYDGRAMGVSDMFDNCHVFNGDLSMWDFSNTPYGIGNFDRNTYAWQANYKPTLP